LKRSSRRRWLARLALVAAVAVIGFSQWNQWWHGNFGVVEPGRVYRSAQPEGSLERLIVERRLATVLNLRGGSPADPFYAEEVRVTRARGLDFYDLPMSPSRRPTRNELLTLLDLFGRCKYPLLIHCKSGSDRTGLVSALYLLACRGVGPDEAGKAFALAYGHIPLFFGAKHLHEPLDEYARWLKENGVAHTPERFRSWVEHGYSSDDDRRGFRPLRPGPRERLAAGASAAGAAGTQR
jgi:hypothetical protein